MKKLLKDASSLTKETKPPKLLPPTSKVKPGRQVGPKAGPFKPVLAANFSRPATSGRDKSRLKDASRPHQQIPAPTSKVKSRNKSILCRDSSSEDDLPKKDLRKFDPRKLNTRSQTARNSTSMGGKFSFRSDYTIPKLPSSALSNVKEKAEKDVPYASSSSYRSLTTKQPRRSHNEKPYARKSSCSTVPRRRTIETTTVSRSSDVPDLPVNSYLSGAQPLLKDLAKSIQLPGFSCAKDDGMHIDVDMNKNAGKNNLLSACRVYDFPSNGSTCIGG